MSEETRYATEADRILDIEGNWDTKALRLHSYAERLQTALAAKEQELVKIREEFDKLRRDRERLINGIHEADSMLNDYLDKYLDMEIPENTEGPKEYTELREITYHLKGTLIPDAAIANSQTPNTTDTKDEK